MTFSRPRPGQRRAVWAWDATAGHARAAAGVTDNATTARETAEQYMHKLDAAAGRVELVTVVIGGKMLEDSYTPTGAGWTAARVGSVVTWTPLPPAAAAS
jgi:hypothetical protein